MLERPILYPEDNERNFPIEANIIAVSVGNTRVAIAMFEQGRITQVERLPYENQINWATSISESWDKIKGRHAAAIVGASVNPNIVNSLTLGVNNLTGQEMLWIGNQIARPIPVLTDAPLVTGLDRVLNIAAAHEMLRKPCLVVDAGTAITIDCGNSRGEFLGGIIAPGVSMMLHALHERTAALPLFEFKVPPDTVGRNTQDAIMQGIYFGVRGMVRETITQYTKYLGATPVVLATGGDSETLFADFDGVNQIVPDLTLQGIAFTYKKHLSNNPEQSA